MKSVVYSESRCLMKVLKRAPPITGQQDPAVAAVTTRSYVVMLQALSCCGHDDQILTNSVTRNSV